MSLELFLVPSVNSGILHHSDAPNYQYGSVNDELSSLYWVRATPSQVQIAVGGVLACTLIRTVLRVDEY